MIRRRNDRGSVLVWGIVIFSVLTVIISVVLTMAYSAYHRSVDHNNKQQAYFTARSVVSTLASEIKNGTATGAAMLNQLSQTGDKVELQNVYFSPEEENTGTVTAYLEIMDTDKLKISATVTVSGQSKTVSVVLSNNDPNSFPFSLYFPGLYISYSVTTVSGEYQINNDISNDIYALDSSSVIFLNDADYDGNIYAIAHSVISISNGSKFSGIIYAEPNASFVILKKLHNYFLGTVYVPDGGVIKVNDIDYTITKGPNNTVNISPSEMDPNFACRIKIYSQSHSSVSWGYAKYE